MGSTNSKGSNSKNGQENNVPEIIVHTKNGQLAGKQFNFEGQMANAFLGIPFAQPPVGQLRFKKPQPLEPWTGVRQAKKFPPQCPQSRASILGRILGASSSEDCLYLNVFSPSFEGENAQKWPVIVFIHGGGFVSGNSQLYGDKGICQHFVSEQKCVFVTIQYRVGPLGFFSTGDDACDDNAGLWDMTMALEWVQANIDAFGGNPQNVTLMGQSAGGVAVDLLALSPHSRDLFHKLIPMAGNSNCEWAFTGNAVDKCRQIAHELGIFTPNSHEMIERLRKVPANKLAMGLSDGRYELGVFKLPLAPRMDGKFFPKSLELLRKEAPPKPRLIGLCQMEGLFFFMMFRSAQFTVSKVQEIIARQFPESKFPQNFQQLRAEALKMFFREDIEKMSADRKSQMKAMAVILSDLFVGIATQKHINEQLALMAQNHPQNAANIFLYTFEYCNPRLLTLLGIAFNFKFPLKACTHSCEIFYIFKNADIKLFGRKLMDENDEKLVKIVTKMWANFAKFGDPNGSKEEPNSLLEGIKWDPVSEEHPNQNLSLTLEPKMHQALQAGRPKRWMELLGKK